jgi:hypothetical protein
MRTTLDIDDDVLQALKERAQRERRTAGRVVTEILREVFTGQHCARHVVTESKSQYGFRPLPANGRLVTNAAVNALRDDEGI